MKGANIVFTVLHLWLDPFLRPSNFILRGANEDTELVKFYKSGSGLRNVNLLGRGVRGNKPWEIGLQAPILC